MEVVKKYWLAGNIDDTLKEIHQILERQDGSIPDTDALLLFAYIFYQLGNMKHAAELLSRVKFDMFDVKQWIVENSILVLKYLESKSLEDQKSIALSFGLLHEKIGGLPFTDVCRLELNVCLNYALVMFCSTTQQVLVPGGYNVSQAGLLKTLSRACASPNYESRQGISQCIEDKLRFYFKNGQEQKQEELNLVATLVLLLATNYLVNSQVSEAKRLMDIVLDLYKPNTVIAKNMDLIFSLMVDSSMFQDFLIPACHLLCSFSLFVLKNKTLSLKYCDRCLSLKPEFISGLFMKGLLLYESGKHEDTIQCFQQIVVLSNDMHGYKSTALNLLGCICAKLGKPHTALLKFRESFACHSGRLEALYNVAVVYHDIGELDLEISLWKYILKILSLRSWYVPDTGAKINVDYICGITAQCLSDSISEDNFLLSTDIHCARRCNFKNSKLSIPSVLFKIAHNCLILKRYSEACEFFGQLLAQLNNKPVDLQESGITSIPTLHKEFAEALFNCDRWDDCLVVCEKILKQETVSNTLSKTLFSQDKAKLDTGKTLIDIMLCKAVVLKELQRPIEANECYESILDAISNNYSESSGEQTNLDEPQQKKQKREKGPTEQHLENYIEMQKFKALTLNKQSLLLSSLGRKKEALLLLTQSISCEPDCLKYRFNHTKLLFDMGMDDVSRKDWLKFRRIDQTTSSSDSKENFKLKDLPEDDEDRDFYVEMDSRALSRLSTKS